MELGDNLAPESWLRESAARADHRQPGWPHAISAESECKSAAVQGDSREDDGDRRFAAESHHRWTRSDAPGARWRREALQTQRNLRLARRSFAGRSSLQRNFDRIDAHADEYALYGGRARVRRRRGV